MALRPPTGRMLDKLRSMLGGGEVDEGELREALGQAAARQPPPVLWLLGSTQAGKTSIVRAMTGSSRAEIGDGFRPCTRSASLYEFPAEAPVVSFLDTRGLGEVHYDPAEDIALCESRAHLLIVVVRVSDIRPATVLEVLAEVRRRHPDWPVIVAQTCLHEAYPDGLEHPQPYPFDQVEWPRSVPEGLRRQLLAQREAFANIPGYGAMLWVPLDFTLPEDGYEPENYGIEALWDAIEHASTLDLRARLRADPSVGDVYGRAAHPQVVGYSLAAAAVGAVPLVDLALVPVLQARLLQLLAGVYGLQWDARRSSEFLGLLGSGFALGYGLRLAGRSVAKLVPGWGQTVGAVWGATASGAITYALGMAACAYLARRAEGHLIEAETLREVYREALGRGRRIVREQHAGHGGHGGHGGKERP